MGQRRRGEHGREQGKGGPKRLRAAKGIVQMGGSIIPHDPFFNRISQIFTNGKRLRQRFCLLVWPVFIRSFVVQGYPSRMGGRRGLVTDEVAARGVRGTRGVVANRFSLGSGQPKPRAGRRKHIADGSKGAASMGASKAKADPSGCVRQRGSCKWEGRFLGWSAFFAANGHALCPAE